VNLKGEPAFVGRHCGANTYEVTKEGVAFYADALDDHNPLYARHAPPLLHHSECYKHLGDWYLKNLFGNLHGQQDWFLFAPIPVGARVRTRSTIIDRYHKRGRDWVVNETDLVLADGSDRDGQLLVRGRTYQSFLPPREESARAGQGEGFVVDEKTAGEKAARRERPPFPTAEGPDLEPVSKVVDQRRCWMFSGPGRNYHTDAGEAKKLGFPNIVVQGMMTTCFVSEVMGNHFGEGWLSGGRMSLKLTNVLWVDEKVTAFARVKDEVPEGTLTRVECEVWVDKADGTRIALGTASALRDGGAG
jgi:acyl dehydratase